MRVKYLAISLATAVLAFLNIAPMATGSPVLTESGRVVLPGSTVTGNSTGFVTFTGESSVICNFASWTGGTLTENSGTRFKGEIQAASFRLGGSGVGSDCTSALGNTAVTLSSKLCYETRNYFNEFDTAALTGCGGSITFTLNFTDLFGGRQCQYSASSLRGGFVTNAKATFNFVNQPLGGSEQNSFLCPSSYGFDADFDLTRFSGSLTLDIS